MAKEVQMGLRVGEVVAVEWLESILGSRRTACSGAFFKKDALSLSGYQMSQDFANRLFLQVNCILPAVM